MGFGYLLLGYLITYLLSITAGAVGIAWLALLVGAVLMFWGLRGLCRFNLSFVPAKWLTLPLFVLGLCRLWQDAIGAWFGWGGHAAEAMTTVVTWVSFAATLFFHFAMLYAIRVLALEVELKKIASHAMYNTLAVGIWAALYLLCNMPSVGERVLPYLGFSMSLFNFAYLISTIVLLVRSTKNICAEGDEEVPLKPSRFAWVNRMGEAYSQTMDKLKKNSRADGDAFWHKHMEKKPQGNTTQKKHKKKKKK